MCTKTSRAENFGVSEDAQAAGSVVQGACILILAGEQCPLQKFEIFLISKWRFGVFGVQCALKHNYSI